MQAIQTLMHEHQTILRALAAVEALVADPANASEPVETWRRCVAFFREYADALHHGKEEDLLFPAMEAAQVPRPGPTDVMRTEHEEGRALVRRMAELSASDTVDTAAIAEPALRYVELLRAHIGKEDHILYPMARRAMAETAQRALDHACAHADEQNFPAPMAEEWETWVRALAVRLGVDRELYVVAPACH